MRIVYANSGEFSSFSDAQAQFDQLINQFSQEDNENNKLGDIHNQPNLFSCTKKLF